MKIPDLSVQFTCFKYFQHVLDQKGTWTRFGYSESDFEEVNKTFCELKSFEDFDCSKDKLKAHIQQNGGVGNYVLKKEGDGGGNVFLDEKILQTIEETTEDGLKSMILMSRIRPLERTGITTDFVEVKAERMYDEVGFYHGNLFRSGKTVESLWSRAGGVMINSAGSGKIIGDGEDWLNGLDLLED